MMEKFLILIYKAVITVSTNMVTIECRDIVFAHYNIIIYELILRVLIMYNTVLLTSVAQFVSCMKLYG